jgi:hypothetical protein
VVAPTIQIPTFTLAPITIPAFTLPPIPTFAWPATAEPTPIPLRAK